MKSDITIVPVHDNSVYIEHYFFVTTTASFIQDLTNRTIPLERFVHDIQNVKSMWIKKLKNSNYYEILLPESIVLCSLGKQSIECNGIYDKSIRNHAEFIKDGIAIGLSKEVIVIDHNHHAVLNKQVSKSCSQDEPLMSETTNRIVEALNLIHNCKQNIDVEANHKLYEVEFENWLSAYDQSAIYQLEANIVSQPQIKYIKVAADDLFEPFTLSFYIDSVLPFPFNHDHIYYIKNVKKEWIRGVLHERYTDGDINVVVLLFDRHLMASDFHMQGDIFLMLDSGQHNNKSNRIYYSQLHTSNILKALLTNQLKHELDSTDNLILNHKSTLALAEEQQHIVKQAILSKQLYYVDGVVTTGKTDVLNCIKSYYENKRVRMLHITSQHQLLEDDRLFKFGQLDNKIDALKSSAFKSLDNYEELILSDKKLITMYASDSLDLEIAELEHKSLTDYLQKYYDAIQKAYIEPLKILWDEFKSNEKLIDTIISKIERDDKKINKQMEKNEFSRWLTLPVLINLQAKVKKNYAHYTDVNQRQMVVSQAYNETSLKLKNTLEDEQIKLKKELWQSQRNHIQTLKARLSKPFFLDSIRFRTYTNKHEHTTFNKEDYIKLNNQLEQLHLALRQYRQSLLRKHDDLFYSLLVKERQSLTMSMQRLHQHFSLFENEFDVVIIDDAQAYTALELFLAISLGKKAIVAGETDSVFVNNKQNNSNDILSTAPSLYKKSGAQALAILLPASLKGELLHLYRVFPSLTYIYNNFMFHDGINIRNRTDLNKLNVLPNVTNAIVLLTTSQSKNHFESDIAGHDLYNHCEAIAIVELIVSMLYLYNEDESNASNKEGKLKPEDILITSFFSMQIDYIRTHLRYAIPSLSLEKIFSMVRPISECTGIEKKVVILSLCVSNKQSSANRDLKQLRHLNLWNIVLSRAKHQLFIIGDIDYVKGTISNERRIGQEAEIEYSLSSYEVANMMKSFIKLAMDGEVQFVSLNNFTKNLEQINGGFGYEQSN